jgi:hypothetical protein
MNKDDLYSVPPGLPVPTDDGACDHLRGAAVPPIPLRSTVNRRVRLDQVPSCWVVVYARREDRPPFRAAVVPRRLVRVPWPRWQTATMDAI